MLWLTPFNDIELNVNAPIDLKLDRLILPFVALAWILALVFGARGALRGRITIIHVAVGVFLLCAFTSVALNAQYLTHTLELQASIKGLPLLLSYVSLFFIAATSIRRVEVDAFLKYTLVLAVICALGMLYEYRFGHNLFYEWSDKLLPGNFTVKHLVPGGLDSDGRRMVRGPAALSLEAVAMLSMALPIALVGRDELRALARPFPTRAGGLPDDGRDVRDVPEERPAGAGLRDPDRRMLPPPRADEARASRPFGTCPGARPCPWRARLDHEAVRPGPAGRVDRERPHRGLRRHPPGPVEPPGLRARLGGLRPPELQDPRLGDPPPRDGDGHHRHARVRLHEHRGPDRHARDDRLARPGVGARRPWRARLRRLRS